MQSDDPPCCNAEYAKLLRSFQEAVRCAIAATATARGPTWCCCRCCAVLGPAAPTAEINLLRQQRGPRGRPAAQVYQAGWKSAKPQLLKARRGDLSWQSAFSWFPRLVTTMDERIDDLEDEEVRPLALGTSLALAPLAVAGQRRTTPAVTRAPTTLKCFHVAIGRRPIFRPVAKRGFLGAAKK